MKERAAREATPWSPDTTSLGQLEAVQIPLRIQPELGPEESPAGILHFRPSSPRAPQVLHLKEPWLCIKTKPCCHGDDSTAAFAISPISLYLSQPFLLLLLLTMSPRSVYVQNLSQEAEMYTEREEPITI